MSKILFLPFSVLGSLIAGQIGKKLFERLWSLIDEQEPPDPKHRSVRWSKVVLTLALEGAILRTVRGLFDRASRSGFSKLTGSWPGEEHPQAS